jgi:AraC-like DNA-binding protein
MGFKMSRTKIESRVKEQYGMSLYEFIKQKIEVEALHDYEIASCLGISPSSIGRFRRLFGIGKTSGFARRFERTYGKGAIETFKRIISDTNNSLADVARHFQFSRENARRIYKRIYGCPYTEAHKKKLLERREKRLAEGSRRSGRIGDLMNIMDKMNSMGIASRVTNTGHGRVVLTNGYKLGLTVATTPVMIGEKHYFRFNNSKCTHRDLDFFICLCKSERVDIHFIIPIEAMPPKCIVSLLPMATEEQSKYTQFREAWHLLSNI